MEYEDLIEPEKAADEVSEVGKELEAEAKTPPRQRAPWKVLLLTGLLAGIIGAGGGAYGVYAGLKAQTPNVSAATAPLKSQIEALETRLAATETLASKAAKNPVSKASPVDLSAIEARLTSLEDRAKEDKAESAVVDLTDIESRLTSLEDAPSPEIDPQALTDLKSAQEDGFEWPDTTKLEARLDALETKTEEQADAAQLTPALDIPSDLENRLAELEAQALVAASANPDDTAVEDSALMAEVIETLESRVTILENAAATRPEVERIAVLAFPKAAMLKAIEGDTEGGFMKKTLSRHVRVKGDNDPQTLIEEIEADIAKGDLDTAAKKYERLPDPVRAAGRAWYESVKASL